jgi:CO dehydrogenase maturation factor
MPFPRRGRRRPFMNSRWQIRRIDTLCLFLAPTVRSTLTAWMKIYGETNNLPGLASGPIEVRFRRLREHTGADLVACLSTSPYVRAQEQGRDKGFEALEPANRTALARLQMEVDSVPQDWAKFTRQAVHFHLKNAKAWGDRATGVDLGAQVDPDFVMGPEAFAAQS